MYTADSQYAGGFLSQIFDVKQDDIGSTKMGSCFKKDFYERESALK